MADIEFILYVADQEKSTEFYRNVLDKEPSLNVPGMTEFDLGENCKLGLMPEKGIVKILSDKTPDPAKGNGIPRSELYLKVDDPQAFIDRAIAEGAVLISELSHRDWGDEVGYVADLDGHVLAFVRR